MAAALYYGMSIREQILNFSDVGIERLDVPEWPVPVYVKVMNGTERRSWNSLAYDAEGKLIDDHYRSRLLAFCLCDESGSLIFQPDDIPALDQKNPLVIQRLFLAARKKNALEPDAVDTAEKN